MSLYEARDASFDFLHFFNPVCLDCETGVGRCFESSLLGSSEHPIIM